MSQRQRRVKERKRERTERRGPSKRQVIAGASIAMGATLAATGSAQADTLTVTNLNDGGGGSLREAVNAANANGPGSDDIVFASGLSGTINLSSDGLYPGSAMNITGPGADKLTVRGTDGVGYIFYTGFNFSEASGSPGDPITISGLTISGGNAVPGTYSENGGGIFNKNATLTISDAVISGNHAGDQGGGIYSYSYPLTLVNSTLSGNTGGSDASGYGGGIYSSDSPVVIRNSTVSGNAVGGDGGGIYMSSTGDPSLTVENSTIANNSSTANGGDDEGGGLWICCGGSGQHLDIKSSTITGNRVGGTRGLGGGVYASLDAAEDVTINNAILANNRGTTGNDLYSIEGVQAAFSLIKDPSNPGGPLNSTGPNIFGVDPQLGALANNGGPTQTELPSPTSPVIDKGNAFGLNTDQRGVTRPIDFPAIPNAADGSDIGAVELQPSTAFKLGKLKRNKKKGTAKQVVILPLPDAGSVTIKGKGLKTKTRQVTGAAKVKLPVIAKGKKRKALNARGKAKIKAQVIYNATGNAANTIKRKLKLLKR